MATPVLFRLVWVVSLAVALPVSPVLSSVHRFASLAMRFMFRGLGALLPLDAARARPPELAHKLERAHPAFRRGRAGLCPRDNSNSTITMDKEMLCPSKTCARSRPLRCAPGPRSPPSLRPAVGATDASRMTTLPNGRPVHNNGALNRRGWPTNSGRGAEQGRFGREQGLVDYE